MRNGKGYVMGIGVLLGLAALILMPLHGQAESAYRVVERGNEYYEAGEYDAAGMQYANASEAFPEAAEIYFNQGNVFYKQRKFLEALAHSTPTLCSRSTAFSRAVSNTTSATSSTGAP